MFIQNWYQCEIQPIFINLNPNEYSQELHYYQFVVKLDNCSGNCSTPNDSSYRVCVPNKTGDLNLHVFNMITAKNESKTLTKNISCKCNCRFDGKNVSQMNAEITINVCVSVKNAMYVKKIVFGILLHIVGKIENIMVDSAIMCDEIIETYDEETKNIPKNFNGKKK